jgi:hypothetical protein
MAKREKGWSKRARQKGYGVEYSTIVYYRNSGILVIRIPQRLQRGWFDAIDYIVVEKGKLGQAKYRKELLHGPEKERMRKTRLCYPNSDLSLELTYRGAKYQPLKREQIE